MYILFVNIAYIYFHFCYLFIYFLHIKIKLPNNYRKNILYENFFKKAAIVERNRVQIEIYCQRKTIKSEKYSNRAYREIYRSDR